MVRAPFYDKSGIKKGAWSAEEDEKLRAYIQSYGHWNWRQLPKFAGVSRCGKSCRLRWKNYLQPGVKHGDFTEQEEALIIKFHEQLGNKWSMIAAKLPGRSDNEIKNYWHTRMKKQIKKRNTKDQEAQTSSSSSQVVLVKDHHQQSCDDHEYSSRHYNSENQLEAHEGATPHCDDSSVELLRPQILESSPVLPPESTFSGSVSEAKSYSSSSSADHEAHGFNVIINCLSDQDTFIASSSETMMLVEGYSDFWTKPFLQDNILMESNIISSSSSSYVLSYDDGMELFYQVMPTPQENS